jgi:NitT/TauT family transport system substrate-binding protein
MRPSRSAFVAGATLAAALALSSAGAEPLKIRADWAVIPGQFAPLIPTVPQYAPGLYKHYGKSYTVEATRMAGGGATLTALAANQTDLSTLSPQSLVLGVVEAKIDLRVIGLQISTEVPGYLQTYFWVRGSEIKRIEELKGKTIGISARGSNVDAAQRMVMAKHGLVEPRDYAVVEIRFPAQLPSLEAKRIDAAVLVPPFNYMAEKNADLKPLFGVGDAFGPVETLMWMARADWVAKNRAALVDFFEDNIRMRRWMFDPKTRLDAIRQVSDATKIPVEAYASWVYTAKDYYYHPEALVDVERLQKNVNSMKEGGIVPAAIDVRPYVDLSLVKEAAARLARN